MGTRYNRLIATLHGRILSGEYAAGKRLPNRTEMVDEFGMSTSTVQRAIDKLVEDGFVEPRFKKGTFVSQFPPHIYRFGLVHWYHYRDSLYIRSLAQVAEEMTAANNFTITPYYPLQSSMQPADDFQQLNDDVISHRLAGMIFVNAPRPMWHDSQTVQAYDIPRVAIVHGNADPGIATAISLDARHFTRLACQQLHSEGRKRVAIIGATSSTKQQREHFIECADEFGLMSRPYWQHEVHYQFSKSARPLAQLLFNGDDAQQRPDALIISDDNLVEQTLLGVADAGVNIPEDLSVIAWGNYPLLPKTEQPVSWIGFDHRRTLEYAMEMLAQMRNGKSVRPRVIEAIMLPAKE